MKTKKDNVIIKTITKAKFDKMPINKKRMAVIQDVLDRISLRQLIPSAGSFARTYKAYDGNTKTKSLYKKLKSPKTKCEVCAKGAFFMAHVGIVNKWNFTDTDMEFDNDSPDADSKEMKKLNKVFSPKQLALIETAFEGTYYNWNVELTQMEISDAITFYDNVNGNSSAILKAICINMLENNGIFKP